MEIHFIVSSPVSLGTTWILWRFFNRFYGFLRLSHGEGEQKSGRCPEAEQEAPWRCPALATCWKSPGGKTFLWFNTRISHFSFSCTKYLGSKVRYRWRSRYTNISRQLKSTGVANLLLRHLEQCHPSTQILGFLLIWALGTRDLVKICVWKPVCFESKGSRRWVIEMINGSWTGTVFYYAK